MFTNMLNHCLNYNFKIVTVFQQDIQFLIIPTTSFYVILLHTNSLIFGFLSRVIQGGQKISGFCQLLSRSDLICEWSTWLPGAKAQGSSLKYVELLLFMFIDVFYIQPVPPHPVSVQRWETSLIFGKVYVKGQQS